jgi:diguanylate cyclase (GGDEF)-like protein
VEFSVIVCDVNGLKFVNDTQGHKAGDEYIRNASGIVCRHFKRSPVYRVGGDEFVVIPQGDDFENMEQILEGFDREVEGNIGTSDAVVSAGHSAYRPGRDRRFHDVFERADALCRKDG